MPTWEAHVETTRAARYLSQLAGHFTHQPGGMTIVSSTSDELHIDLLGQATWSLHATPEALVMRLQGENLSGMSAKVAGRIEQLGRRDGLRVQWRPSAGSGGVLTEEAG
ncbi:DUF2218 domain-containing protein [Kribbella sp. NPDC051952]|uniref:DUF2218 domain-containing protein n=1 Tax=Kribbella sp. NPDC051952 TaxID=3154851 RepID=UPI003421BDFC